MRYFEILGEPQGKGRPRFSVVNGAVNTRTPEKTAVYENLVKVLYKKACNEPMFEKDIPLIVRITAFYGIPKSVSNKKRTMMLSEQIRPTKKPDIDNLCKIVMDSLNKIAYYDDSQVIATIVSKFYSDYPRVCVSIMSLEEYQKLHVGERI